MSAPHALKIRHFSSPFPPFPWKGYFLALYRSASDYASSAEPEAIILPSRYSSCGTVQNDP